MELHKNVTNLLGVRPQRVVVNTSSMVSSTSQLGSMLVQITILAPLEGPNASLTSYCNELVSAEALADGLKKTYKQGLLRQEGAVILGEGQVLVGAATIITGLFGTLFALLLILCTYLRIVRKCSS